MMKIEAHTFEMGCTAGMSSCQPEESPAHFVTLTNDFYIGETEVTQGEYEEMMGTNPSYFSSCGLDCPVESLSWHMAAAFANAVSDSEGLEQCYTCTGDGTSTDCFVAVSPYSCAGYRLPTEAEWEAAARCGEDLVYAGSTVVGDVAWYSGTSGGTTHPIATKASNACGLHDMLGNIKEWTQDWYITDYYSSSPSADPGGGSSPEDSVFGVRRVIRGGSWFDVSGGSARVSSRGRDDHNNARDENGVRLVRTSP
jgi:formylglycine-generating enzyme required for sulfatase activity